MKNLLIIDGRHLLWRTHDAFSDLVVDINGVETPIGGVYGFLLTLLRIYKRYGGEVNVCWEGKNNFRYKLYPAYKGKDKEIDEDKLLLIEEMAGQELRLKSILRALGITQYRSVDCEADDTMATLAKRNSLAMYGNGKSIIYTGDSDLRQAVNDDIKVVAPGRKGKDAVYDAGAVFAKHGVHPDFIADLKALSGDSSDNIPGVRGIGPKTAVKLIDVFGHVENVIANVSSTEWPVAERFRTAVSTSADDILLYKKLTKLKEDVQLDPIKPKRDGKVVYEYFKLYRFSSLMIPTEMNAFSAMVKHEQ